jgi:hypothetical protein
LRHSQRSASGKLALIPMLPWKYKQKKQAWSRLQACFEI